MSKVTSERFEYLPDSKYSTAKACSQSYWLVKGSSIFLSIQIIIFRGITFMMKEILEMG